MKFGSLVSKIGKPVNTAEALINRSSKWVAEHFGVSRRTAQKWKAGTQQPGKRVGGPETVIKSADADTRRKVAADAVRHAKGAVVGRVPVVDKSPKGKAVKSYRNIKPVRFNTPADRARLDAAADALERGDTARAEEIMSEAILASYGGGAEASLSIEDWPSGFHLM